MKVQLPAPKKARIEMLPLIDIVFLLLVFFIYAMLSMAVHRGLPVELPLSATAEIDKKLILFCFGEKADSDQWKKTQTTHKNHHGQSNDDLWF